MLVALKFWGVDGASILSFARKKKKATRKERETDRLSQQYALARFQPLLMELLEELTSGSLTLDGFPHIRSPEFNQATARVCTVHEYFHPHSGLFLDPIIDCATIPDVSECIRSKLLCSSCIPRLYMNGLPAAEISAIALPLVCWFFVRR